MEELSPVAFFVSRLMERRSSRLSGAPGICWKGTSVASSVQFSQHLPRHAVGQAVPLGLQWHRQLMLRYHLHDFLVSVHLCEKAWDPTGAHFPGSFMSVSKRRLRNIFWSHVASFISHHFSDLTQFETGWQCCWRTISDFKYLFQLPSVFLRVPNHLKYKTRG